MQEFLRFLVEPLVSQPAQIEVQEMEVDGGLKFELKVAEEDKGKVIGKQGRVIKAIRVLLNTASARSSGRKIFLSLG
ncbi:MAG: KH domain-containing protein [Elusimicrobia bacterium]|nr:KH domain-containing protein [Elusimicrobiota bacterium]